MPVDDMVCAQGASVNRDLLQWSPAMSATAIWMIFAEPTFTEHLQNGGIDIELYFCVFPHGVAYHGCWKNRPLSVSFDFANLYFVCILIMVLSLAVRFKNIRICVTSKENHRYAEVPN